MEPQLEKKGNFENLLLVENPMGLFSKTLALTLFSAGQELT